MNLNAPSKNVIDKSMFYYFSPSEGSKIKTDMGEKDALAALNNDKNEAAPQKADHVKDQNNVTLDNGLPSQDAESVIERQKRIEEENKRKKAAIAKALED